MLSVNKVKMLLAKTTGLVRKKNKARLAEQCQLGSD